MKKKARKMSVAASANRGLRTIEEAMGQLSCSRARIYQLGKDKKLELVKFGALTRVTERSLNALVDEILTGDGRAMSYKPQE